METCSVLSPADAARAVCDPARADVVAFDDIAPAIARAAFRLARARRRLRNATGDAVDAARAGFDVIADSVAADVVDAVADACDGFEMDATPVVVLPSGAIEAAGILQRAGVSYVRAGDARDCGVAWIASHAGAPCRPFATVADAVAYASGVAPAPVSRRRRAR